MKTPKNPWLNPSKTPADARLRVLMILDTAANTKAQPVDSHHIPIHAPFDWKLACNIINGRLDNTW